jgi:hypothetical protein
MEGTPASLPGLVFVPSGTFAPTAFGKGGQREMYWYNPTTQNSERVAAPSSDEEALDMLTGGPDSAQFVKEYIKLRDSGTPIEPALVLVGHEFRLRESEYQPALR